ncbi:hypothetical protein CLAFUW4_04696 [Fulvia fulva]|uniref:DNA replication factor Cdt1 C-terminal domain-containing protein n=1 Tax=Passalora fulva TaxID=5499 RepID=A0A9Q8LGR3_PASFU|nr:uncharacterized protein CLAFUR5_04656 [Fulvia fulva]KAK4627262.1 hypothetical protein CLAFUR4_04682 [Fulvia fulva]KAK4627369.1 hypothetical protein CLAFUR0_04686 [Fulvia fulva]UJO17152.1 hypothetical protein CLAFUR5_04656 [Fulvia fulva]WPV14273.1 hypothetical protein CLAFUW4_04696 [Fulvia fulva]WPV29071.1 hypothetical protein CLAFUW7_04690 [Fulvia fulva]
MPVQRKRKAVAVVETASKQSRPTKAQRGIKSFGSIGKANTVDSDVKKRKTQHGRDQTPPPAPAAKVATTAQNKRKRAIDTEDDEDEIIVSSKASTSANDISSNVMSTPRNKRIKNVAPPSPAQTSTRGAAALFDNLKLDANARAIPCALTQQKLSYETPPDTPKHEKRDLDLSFPVELEKLEDLYSSFLKSLHLYYSHHGSASPVELGTLLPSLSKHWKKRAVKLEDVQRILAVSDQKQRSFTLQDFGRAGICLVRTEAQGRALKRSSSYIDEDELNRKFEDALQKSWYTWQHSVPKENRTASVFLDQLPLLEITQNEATAKAAPIFARGQQRLADLKAGVAAARAEAPKPSSEEVAAIKSVKAAQTRGTALLDRILAKQNLSSGLASGPTKEQLERKSALHRLDDVARVLSLLVGTKERCSLSMPAITQQLQQSLRNPISRDEVDRCLTLLDKEIAPGFVRVIQSGEVKGIVIVRSASVGLAEIRARVDRTLA